jgi:hypothetical protein
MSSPRLARWTCRPVLRLLWPAGALMLAGALVGIAPAGASASACTAFTGVQPPSPGTGGNSFNGVTVRSSCNAWAVGDYTNGGTVFKTLIEHWNGSAWRQKTSVNPGSSTNVLDGVAAVASRNVWAVGSETSGPDQRTLIEHWNGTAWSDSASTTPSSSVQSILFSVAAVSARNVWAVGFFYNGSLNQTLIEHWNGSAWHRVRSPDPPGPNVLQSVAATSATNVWAVGYNDENGTLIEHWNGTAWRVVKSPNTGDGSVLTSVAASSRRHAWAVGDDASGTLALRWNGTRWRHVASRNLGIEDVLNSVTAISARNAWAVGYYNNRSVFDSLIEHWNGSTWKVVASPSPNPGTDNPLDGVAATSSRNVWAVGDYVINGTGERALAVHCC